MRKKEKRMTLDRFLEIIRLLGGDDEQQAPIQLSAERVNNTVISKKNPSSNQALHG